MTRATITLRTRELHHVAEHEQSFFFRPFTPLGEDLAPVTTSFTASPFGHIGELLHVQERLWVSECRQYYAQDARQASGEWYYDVVTQDGEKRWLTNRYVPSGFADTDPRYLYSEFPHMVGSWHNLGRTLRSGRDTVAFRLGFYDLDTSIRIQSSKGNAVQASYEATFRHQLPGRQMPRWAERLTIELTAIAVLPLMDALQQVGKSWRHAYWVFSEYCGEAKAQKDPLVWQLGYRQVSSKDFAQGQCPHLAQVP